MKDRMNIVQLRSTIFILQNIGYTPQNAERFKEILLPEGKIYGIPQPGIPVLGTNPTIPQFGMPWRIFLKTDEGDYNIAFQPGKIDIILAKEVIYGDDTEKEFCRKSADLFSKIINEYGGISATRIAYAPLYSVSTDDGNNNIIWNLLLKKTVFDGIPSQDINLSFLLKKKITIGDKNVSMNLLYNLFDGNQIKNENGKETVNKVLLLQLDLNSVAEEILNLSCENISEFFESILDIKCKLIDNVTE